MIPGDDAAPRVLVVDDTDHVRNMLVDMLGIDGFDVVGSAASAEEAIALAVELDPHVVVMDYRMPRTDGVEATRRIRAVRPSQTIILYTAYLDDRIEARARAAGVALCIGKVSGLPELERSIADFCRDLRPT